MTSTPKPRLGIALGGGSARGWAHIGVLSALVEDGLEPDVVCGTSVGALVGGVYAAGKLPELEAWVGALTRRDVVALVDLTVTGGGMMGGRRLMALYRQHVGDVMIQDLPRPYAAVATDLRTGSEVWLRDGELLTAIRASISIPGLFTPVLRDGRWLVDGGLVNPVPVTLCRALGADVVIAVDLQSAAPTTTAREQCEGSDDDTLPSVRSVIAMSLDVMQARLSRARLVGDPPDLLLAPRVRHIPLLEFSGGQPTIEEGYQVMRRAIPTLRDIMALPRL
jgi:NTE family protein